MRIVLALGLLLGLGATAVSTDAARPLGSQGQASAVKRSADRAITAQGTVVYEQIASVMRVALKIAALDGAGARFLTPLAHPGEVRADCCASFSPDGQLVAFFRQFRTGRALEMIAASGGPSHPLITQARATQLSGQRARLGDVVWTPDGKRLAVGVAAGTQACGGEGVLAVNADGTNARWLVPLSFAPTRTLLYLGAWSPNGDQILVIAESNDGDCYLGHEGTSRLLIAHDGPGGRPHSILKSNHMRDPVWSPTAAASLSRPNAARSATSSRSIPQAKQSERSRISERPRTSLAPPWHGEIPTMIYSSYTATSSSRSAEPADDQAPSPTPCHAIPLVLTPKYSALWTDRWLDSF